MSIRSILSSGPLGCGGAPLGNMFRAMPENEALATIEAAWDQGTRFFDTAPFYGAGVSIESISCGSTTLPRISMVTNGSPSSKKRVPVPFAH
jgi:hypothetical protein